MIKIDNKNSFLIAEIGHNHQGDIKKAFKLFQAAKSSGADAVKLQKRENKLLYTKKFYNQIYNSKNSFGKTYGEHREFLEFDEHQYKELKSYAKELNIFFFATAFDFQSVEFLEKLDMPAYKIASADLLNFPLQNQIAKTNKLVILSTGGGTLNEVRMAVENISKINNNLIIMQCTSSYPVDIHEMNLNVISTYKKEFPNLTIGLSDHENGIDAATTKCRQCSRNKWVASNSLINS
jgi:N-acetylneuraminate synthase/sialic acid synthase